MFFGVTLNEIAGYVHGAAQMSHDSNRLSVNRPTLERHFVLQT